MFAKTSPRKAAARFLKESAFLRHYVWKYRRWIGIGLASLILVDFLEIFPPLLLKRAVDAVQDRQPSQELHRIAAVYLGIAVIQGFCRYAWRMYLIRSSLFAGRDIRRGFTRHVFGLSTSFFDRRRIGDLMSLSTSDVEAVRIAVGSGLLVFADAMFYFATIPVAMYWLSPKLTLLALLPLPVIPWIVMRNEREIHLRYEKVQESFSRLSAMTQEALNGVRVVKAFAREDAQSRRFREAGEEYLQLNLRLARVQTAFGPTLDFTMSLGLVLLLFVGGRDLIQGDSGWVTLGTFVAFQRYIQKMVWPMAAVGMAINFYQRAVTSAARLEQVQALSSDVADVPCPKLPRLDPRTGKTAGRIEFRGLSFRFPGEEREVLRGITLTIEPGERVAFLGTVGAGKSALLSLLVRLYPVSRGMLLIDGVDVNDWPLEELRRQVGYVSQDVFLFSETVVENVAYGLHDWREGTSAFSTSRIEQATELAAIHDEVLQLSGAYSTRLGERGVNLSGGQKQRLTIARALAKEPPILVLDDALSSVDVQTEERILRSLRERPGRNTELIAAHRISTIRDADRIAVLEDGAILQLGTHAELMAEPSGAYARIYRHQRMKEDLEHFAGKIEETVP